LAWYEDLTLISKQGAPAIYEKLEQTFAPEEIVALTLAIVAINGWNRAATCMRSPVGIRSDLRPPASPLGSPEHTPTRKVNHARSRT
jgi:hypothetical protein